MKMDLAMTTAEREALTVAIEHRIEHLDEVARERPQLAEWAAGTTGDLLSAVDKLGLKLRLRR